RSSTGGAMPGRSFRFPVWRKFIGAEAVLEWQLPLLLRSADEPDIDLLFLFDPGSDFTTIAIPDAERLQIPFDRGKPVGIRAATGTAHGFLAPMWFSLAPLPEFQFESLCCFSASPLPRPLLSLKDVIAHFRLRTLLPSHLHPLGSLILQLHGR